LVDSVALVKYEGNVEKTLEKGIGLLDGLGDLRSPFLIKPNIWTVMDRTGYSNTDVQLIEDLLDFVLGEDRNLSIKIVESDSESKFASEVFEKFGYMAIEKKYTELGFDVSLVNLSHSTTIPVKLNGLHFKNIELPDMIAAPKYLISLAVAKTHELTFVTGSVKNLFGLLPRKDKSAYHPSVNDVIVGLNRIARPNLCIVDARVGLEGWAGPKTKQINAFILGRKPVSVDATMARIMGFKPEKIRHLVEAEKYGLGSLNPKIRGENLDSLKVKFNPPFHLSSRAVI
jgi:uncharacterized protein (DUF362 family)